jgi:signal transduction histidine kinase
MRNWRSSAAYRIAFINFGAYAAGLALLGVVMFAVMHVAFARQLDSMVVDESVTLQQEYATGGERELAEAIAEREASSSSTRMLYAVFAPDGRRIYGSLQTKRPRLGVHPISFYDPGEGPNDGARAATVDLASGDRVVVAVDSEWLERIEGVVILIFSLAFLGSLVVGFGGAVMLGSYLRRRLHSISSSAEAIIAGDTRRRMPVSPRKDEFDQLAVTLNRMLDRIEGLLDNLQQVSSDIAHDLRTPLARLRNHLERGDRTSNDQALIPDAIRQVDEVLSLFAAILRVAEVESGERKRFFEAVDVTALLNEVAESFSLAFEDVGRTFLWSIEPNLVVDGDRDLLAQAMINLVENAQRHTPAGTIVRMTAVSARDLVSLQVEDNGAGVPKADLARITKRFARLERSRNTAGHGLGLSLVSAVAKLHGGDLVLKSTKSGLSATMEIPKRAAPKPHPQAAER